jgi:hypothetical protein
MTAMNRVAYKTDRPVKLDNFTIGKVEKKYWKDQFSNTYITFYAE